MTRWVRPDRAALRPPAPERCPALRVLQRAVSRAKSKARYRCNYRLLGDGIVEERGLRMDQPEDRMPATLFDAVTGGDEVTTEQKIIVPVVAEELVVAKRVRETGKVRVTTRVTERQEVVDEPLEQEDVLVERVPVNRVVEGPVEIRQEGDTMIVPILEEVLVIEKRLMLKEEVRITRRRAVTHTPQTVTLRREEVEVERLPLENGNDMPLAEGRQAAEK